MSVGASEIMVCGRRGRHSAGGGVHAFQFRFLFYYYFIQSRDAKRRDFSVSESIVL